MFSMLRLLGCETRFLYFTKKNYMQQFIFHIFDKSIFLLGMYSVLIISNYTLDLYMFIKVSFWFCLVNGFDEIVERTENELRRKQQINLLNKKTPYLYQCITKTTVQLLDSFIIILIAYFFISSSITNTEIDLISFVYYIFEAYIQYLIINILLISLTLKYERIRALLGFIEFSCFFYLGLVIPNNLFSIPVFTWLNMILEGNFSNMLLLNCFVILEIFVINKFVLTNKIMKQ